MRCAAQIKISSRTTRVDLVRVHVIQAAPVTLSLKRLVTLLLRSLNDCCSARTLNKCVLTQSSWWVIQALAWPERLGPLISRTGPSIIRCAVSEGRKQLSHFHIIFLSSNSCQLADNHLVVALRSFSHSYTSPAPQHHHQTGSACGLIQK